MLATKENRINSLKQQLNGFKNIAGAWKVIETGDNANFIADNITSFIPAVNGGLMPEADNYFTPLAILCTWKPRAFGDLLEKLGDNKKEFLSTILSYNGRSMTQFETALILSDPGVCTSILDAYKLFDIDLKSSNQPGLALKTCYELNQLLKSGSLEQIQEGFHKYKRTATASNIQSQLDCFPKCYHSSIIGFAQKAFNIELGGAGGGKTLG